MIKKNVDSISPVWQLVCQGFGPCLRLCRRKLISFACLLFAITSFSCQKHAVFLFRIDEGRFIPAAAMDIQREFDRTMREMKNNFQAAGGL